MTQQQNPPVLGALVGGQQIHVRFDVPLEAIISSPVQVTVSWTPRHQVGATRCRRLQRLPRSRSWWSITGLPLEVSQAHMIRAYVKGAVEGFIMRVPRAYSKSSNRYKREHNLVLAPNSNVSTRHSFPLFSLILVSQLFQFQRSQPGQSEPILILTTPAKLKVAFLIKWTLPSSRTTSLISTPCMSKAGSESPQKILGN